MSEDRINVVFFPAWFPTEVNTLGGKFVLDHAKALKGLANVAIVYINADEKLNKLFELKKERVEGFSTIVLSFKKLKSIFFPLNAVLYFIASFYVFFTERKRLKKASLNHVHVLTRAAFLPYLVKLFYGIPYVISEHWSRYLPENNTYKGSLRKFVTRFFVAQSSGIAAVSENLKNALLAHQLTHSNFKVIRNVLDVVKFFPKEKEEGIFSILHVSGLNDQVKNVSGILRAAKILEDKGYEFRLKIVGDDAVEGPIIKRYSKLLKLNSVIFTGKIFGDELTECYQQADVFVLNSNFDNQPYVLLEAMSCGVPVIATAVGGVPEMLTDFTGILVPPNRDDLLAKILAEFVAGEQIFDSGKIRDYVIENYSYETIGKTIHDFYSAALNR